MPVENRFLPLLVLLFIGSGSAALIYEIVWFQLLSLIVGSSAVSMGVLLGTFMGGMCLGSLLFSKYIKRSEHPLRAYAKLEAGIAICGLLVLWLLPYVGGLYFKIAIHGPAGIFVRAIFCAICLLPPTLMMGATLPAIARWVETSSKEGVAWLGFFYGGNIAGAVFGCLLAGFYLLRVHDMAFATYVAVAIDIVVVLASLALAKATVYDAPEQDPAAEPKKWWSIPQGTWPVYVTLGISGATALASEAVWTRMLSLLLGATTYTFSLILASFLTGLGIGSSVGSMMTRQMKNPRVALGVCQLLLTVMIAWAAYTMTRQLPYWPVTPGMSGNPNNQFQIDLVRCLWVVLPAAILWGASFPFALASIGKEESDPGRLVGTLYAANTVGAIVGALFGSLLVIAWAGTQNANRILIAAAAISSAIAFAATYSDEAKKIVVTTRGLAGAAVAAILAVILIPRVQPVPPLLVGYGRWFVNRLANEHDFIYMGEGMVSSVAVSKLSNGVLNYHNAGKVQASSEPQDMRLQRMLGHLTTLLPNTGASVNKQNVLVIGCGAGVTAGAVSISPALERETIAEIEPLVPKVVSKYFGDHNYHVVDNPKVHVEIDDARHFILTTDQKFDAVTSDPLDPWVKGAATLYTKEFFTVVKSKLKKGGVVTLFVQLYESNTEAVKSEVATFLEAFPNGVVFGNTYNGAGYDLVLVGQEGDAPMKIDVDAVEKRLASPEYAQVAQSLREIGFNNATELFSTFAGNAQMLKPWTQDAQINHDRNLRLQFLAGLGLNLYDQAGIYSQMVQYRRYPEGMFTGTEEQLAKIRMATGGF
jgi:spermidine synthase